MNTTDAISNTARHDFGMTLKRKFESDEGTDMVVHCADRSWNIHRVILSAGSDYFDKACDEIVAEAGAMDSITLKEDDPRMVEVMLRYFYAHDYNHDNDEAILAFHAQVYAIADKYNVEMLKKLAVSKFSAWSEGGSSLNVTDFINAIKVIYIPSLDSENGIRFLIVRAAFGKCRTNLVASDEFANLIKSGGAGGEYAMDVIKARDRHYLVR